MYRHDKFGLSPISYPREELVCSLGNSRSRPTGSQIPLVIEESSYVCRHMFPQVSPEDIPQPEGKIYRG